MVSLILAILQFSSKLGHKRMCYYDFGVKEVILNFMKNLCLHNVDIRKTQICQRSYKTTIMPKSFVYGPILMKICMNAKFMNTHFSSNYTGPEVPLLCHREVL